MTCRRGADALSGIEQAEQSCLVPFSGEEQRPGFIARSSTGSMGILTWLAPHSNGPCSGFSPDSPNAIAQAIKRLPKIQFSIKRIDYNPSSLLFFIDFFFFY